MAIVLMESWISTAVSRVAVGPYYILIAANASLLWVFSLENNNNNKGRANKKDENVIIIHKQI